MIIFQKGFLFQKLKEKKCLQISPDAPSGVIRLRTPPDREGRPSYSLLVVAADGGRPPHLASRLLTVRVKDVDDNGPSFPDFKVNKSLHFFSEKKYSNNIVLVIALTLLMLRLIVLKLFMLSLIVSTLLMLTTTGPALLTLIRCALRNNQ